MGGGCESVLVGLGVEVVAGEARRIWRVRGDGRVGDGAGAAGGEKGWWARWVTEEAGRVTDTVGWAGWRCVALCAGPAGSCHQGVGATAH